MCLDRLAGIFPPLGNIFSMENLCRKLLAGRGTLTYMQNNSAAIDCNLRQSFLVGKVSGGCKFQLFTHEK